MSFDDQKSQSYKSPLILKLSTYVLCLLLGNRKRASFNCGFLPPTFSFPDMAQKSLPASGQATESCVPGHVPLLRRVYVLRR